jgi:hypothetical protein
MRVVALQRDCSKAQPELDSGLLVSKRFCSTAANFSSVEHAVTYGFLALPVYVLSM